MPLAVSPLSSNGRMTGSTSSALRCLSAMTSNSAHTGAENNNSARLARVFFINLSRTSRNQKLERRRPRRQTPYQADGDVGAPTSGIATLNPTQTWEAAPVFDLRYILVTNCDDLRSEE